MTPENPYNAPPGQSPYPRASGRPPRREVDLAVIGDAWRIVTGNLGPFIIASLMLVVIGFVCYAVFFAPVFMAAFSAGASGETAAQPDIVMQLLLGLGFQISFSVAAGLVMSSIVQMGLKGIRGEEISVSDAFSGFTNQPLQVLLAGLLVGIATGIGTMLCYLPGFIVAGLLSLTIPYIVDRKMSAIEGLKASWSTMSPFWVMGALLFFVGSLVAGLGACACFVGMFVTFPMLYVTNSVVYEDLTADPYGQAPAAPAPY